MTRRTHGPKRKAEAYAAAQLPAGEVYGRAVFMRSQLAIAWMAGYRAASRARRIARPKPRKPGEPMPTPPTPATQGG